MSTPKLSRVGDVLKIGSLFSGIGGLELGLERGLAVHGVDAKTIWQCEIDSFARSVLKRHWPSATIYEDIRTMESIEHVDLICGGFPCQDLSYAGRRAGLAGKRSGLFWELMRIVRMVGPRYVVLENVPGLLTADEGEAMGSVLGALASCGYDAEWDCIPASSVGAHHRRDRIFILAYSGQTRRERSSGRLEASPFEPSKTLSEWGYDFGVARMVLWEAEHIAPPASIRVVDGVPSRLDSARFGALGNAVVPRVAEVIGRRIGELHIRCGGCES